MKSNRSFHGKWGRNQKIRARRTNKSNHVAYFVLMVILLASCLYWLLSKNSEIEVEFVRAAAASEIIEQIEEPTPQLSPTTSPTPAPMVSEIERVKQIIREVWGPDAEVGIKLADCESDFRANAANPHSSARGVFQFIERTWIDFRNQLGKDPDLDLRFDARENIETAYELYKLNGLQDWSPSIQCVNAL